MGENWRVGRSSTTPPSGMNMLWDPELYRSECNLSPERVDGLCCGSFRGSACEFSVLEQAWSRVLAASEFVSNNMGRNGLAVADLAPWADGGSAMCISLDFAPDLFGEWGSTQPYNVPRGFTQHTLARRLLDKFKSADLVVLHLGAWADDPVPSAPEVFPTSHFSLILVRPFHVTNSTGQGFKDSSWDWVYVHGNHRMFLGNRTHPQFCNDRRMGTGCGFQRNSPRESLYPHVLRPTTRGSQVNSGSI